MAIGWYLVVSALIFCTGAGGVLAQDFYHAYHARVMSLLLANTYAGWKGSLPLTMYDAPASNDQRANDPVVG